MGERWRKMKSVNEKKYEKVLYEECEIILLMFSTSVGLLVCCKLLLSIESQAPICDFHYPSSWWWL